MDASAFRAELVESALFEDATLGPVGGQRPCRAFLASADPMADLGDVRVRRESIRAMISRADVVRPEPGMRLTIRGESYIVRSVEVDQPDDPRKLWWHVVCLEGG